MLLIFIKIISEVDMKIFSCISPMKKKRKNVLSSIDSKTIATNFPWTVRNRIYYHSQVVIRKMNFECA